MESHDGVHLIKPSVLPPIDETSTVIDASPMPLPRQVPQESEEENELVEVNLSKVLRIVNQQTLKGYKAGYTDGYKDGSKDSFVSFFNGVSVGMILSGLYLYMKSRN